MTVSKNQLAILGGPPMVKKGRRDGWRKIHLRDMFTIARHAYRDINTAVGAKGPIGDLEHGFRKLTETRFAIAMNSGTAALHSSYFAVGVRPGDEVIVPSYTFAASATPIVLLGATPVFCDIDERTLTADPDDVERRITRKTKAICVVHVWGNPARLDRFAEISRKHNVPLIEDCSHAHGAAYQGKPVGGWGDIGCFSLQGSKPVSAGEGGIAVTNNSYFHDQMLALGHFGRTATDMKSGLIDIGNLSLGVKYRPHLYGVILALGGLSRLAELNRLRQRNYDILRAELSQCRAVSLIESYPDARRGGFLEFILRYDSKSAGGWNRGAFVNAAKSEGVPIAVDRYTLAGSRASLLHETPLFSSIDLSKFAGSVNQSGRQTNSAATVLPVSSRIADQLMTLPALTKVPARYVKYCASALKKVAQVADTMADLRGTVATKS